MPINKVMQCPISLNCGGYLLINSKIKSITSGAAWYLSLETTAIIIFSAVPGCMCSVKRVEGKADSGNKECCDNLQTRQDLASPWSRERDGFLLFQDYLHEFSHKAKIYYSLVVHVLATCYRLLDYVSSPQFETFHTPAADQFLVTIKYSHCTQGPLRHPCLFKYSSFLLYHTEHTSCWGFSYLTKQIWYERSHTLTHHISEMIKQNQRTSQRSGLTDHIISSEPRPESPPTDCVTQPSQRRPPGVSIF